MQPVDPVALGIPDYLTVIKHPMDISTLAQNLEEGKYSRIPPSRSNGEGADEDGTDHPAYRMAYGPFHDATMLIFDNCIQYNGEATWIGGEASILKRNVIKKMEQLVSKAVWSGQGRAGAASSSGTSLRKVTKKSLYVDEDSDVDMYEYESEYDDSDDGGGRRKRSKARGKPKRTKKGRAKEDIPSNAIEQPFMLPDRAHGFGTGGAFPHLKILTNVGKFSLSTKEWSCRYIQDDPNMGAGVDDDKGEDQDAGANGEDEELALLLMQQEEVGGAEGSVRRSTRERQ